MSDEQPVDAEVVDDLTATEATEITRRIRAWVREFPLEDVKRAFFGRIWIALSYDSWQEWCECELNGLQLTHDLRVDITEQLAEAGMSNRAIAPAFGGLGKDCAQRPNCGQVRSSVEAHRH